MFAACIRYKLQLCVNMLYVHVLSLSGNIWRSLSQQLNSHQASAAGAAPCLLHLHSFLTPAHRLPRPPCVNTEIIQQQSFNEIWNHPWCDTACSSDQLEYSVKGKDETFSFHEDVPKIPSFYPTERHCCSMQRQTRAPGANKSQIWHFFENWDVFSWVSLWT